MGIQKCLKYRCQIALSDIQALKICGNFGRNLSVDSTHKSLNDEEDVKEDEKQFCSFKFDLQLYTVSHLGGSFLFCNMV